MTINEIGIIIVLYMLITAIPIVKIIEKSKDPEMGYNVLKSNCKLP